MSLQKTQTHFELRNPIMTNTEQSSRLNHILLQKNLVYLLHRPVYAKKTIKKIEKTILAQNLTRDEIAWLKSIDVRRWSIDHERPYRTIEGALFHCPVTALVFSSLFHKLKQKYIKESNTLSFLTNYFKSDEFLHCIRDGQHIVDTLLLWLNKKVEALNLPKAFSKDRSIFLQLSSLELKLIKARRLELILSPPSTKPPAQIQADQRLFLPKSIMLFQGSLGLSEAFILLNQEAIKLSNQQGRSALLLAKINLQKLPIDLSHSCTIMIQKNLPNSELSLLEQSSSKAQNCSIESLPDHLAQVLKFVQAQPTYQELESLMFGYELNQDESLELVQEWLENNLISLKS